MNHDKIIQYFPQQYNDIALVELSDRTSFNTKIAPVCLPDISGSAMDWSTGSSFLKKG
jgi:hypothetical protein